ncbi:MAG TPA: hypothetical protein VFG14_05605 [Chthoniobacteraceae bacterium]|nr:hypothetical protein [Chthoniobacteraceae bacterium]
MWQTEPLSGRPGELASTPHAVDAAERVFFTVKLRGMTRHAVIRLLGDPQHSNRSTYNFPFYPAPKDSMVYRFDTGAGGFQFNILFDRQDRVRKVQRYGIE